MATSRFFLSFLSPLPLALSLTVVLRAVALRLLLAFTFVACFNWYAPGETLQGRSVALRVERVHETGQERGLVC